jgi:hypothetical protein
MGRTQTSARSKLLLVTVVACVLGSLPAAVHAHASLTTPRSRNVAFFNGNWYANGGNGLGPVPFRRAGIPGEFLVVPRALGCYTVLQPGQRAC